MSDVSIDKLKIDIEASSSKAEESLTKLSNALLNLNNQLKGLDKLTRLTNSLTQLASIKFDASKNGLFTFVNSMKGLITSDFSGFNSKVTSFVNSLGRLANVDFSDSSKKINSFFKDIRKITDMNMSGIDSKITGFVRSISRLISISSKGTDADKMNETAESLRNVVQSVSDIQVSDNIANLVHGLGQLASHASTAEKQMKGVTDQYTLFEIKGESIVNAVKGICNSFKELVSILKKVGSFGLNAFKGLINSVKQLSQHKPKVEGLNISFKNLLKTVLGFKGITGVFNWLKESVSLGAEVTEIDHIVESVFGTNMTKYVDEWAENAIEKFGIAANSAKKYAGTLTAMFQSSNVGLKDSNTMALKLTELAGDLSAFYNIDTETAYNKIKSGMAGMVRPLRDLGIDLTAATLAEYAQTKGIEKKYSAMTQAEKIMLRYQYLMERTTTQAGDFQRTNMSLANSLRTLKAYVQSISTEFGAGLAAAIRHVVVWLNSLMKHIVKAAKYFREFMETIFGKYKGGASGMAFDASQIEEADSYTADLSDNASSVADGLDDASSAAKKLKDKLSVLPFDELNQLSKDTSSDSDSKITGIADGLGGYGDALADLLDFDEAESKLSKFEEFVKGWASRLKMYFKAHDWEMLGRALAQGLNKGIKALYNVLDPSKAKEKINKWVDAFTRTFNSFIKYLDFETIGRTLGEGIDILISTANRLLDPKTGIDWVTLGKKLASGANGLVDQIPWEEIGNFFANKLNYIWEIAYGFVTEFNWGKLGDSLAEGAYAFVKKIDFVSMADTISVGLNGIIESIETFLTDFDARAFGSKLGLAFKRMIDGVSWKDLGKALADIWNDAWDFLKGFITQIGSGSNGLDVQSAIDEKLAIKNGKEYSSVKTIGTGIGQAIHDAMKGTIENISVDDMIGSINIFFGKIFDDIITVFGDEKNWYELGHKIGEVLAGIVGNPENAEKAASAVTAITNGLKAMFVGAIDALKDNSTEITSSIKTFLSKLPWDTIFKVVGLIVVKNLIGVIPTIFGGWLIKATLTKTISGVLAQSISEATKSAVAGAAEGAVAEATTAVNTVSSAGAAGSGVTGIISKALFGTATTTVGAAGITAAFVKIGEAGKSLFEIIKGGNGRFTKGGDAVQSYIDKLSALNDIQTDAQSKLFKLKESWENGEISDDTFISQFASMLGDFGINADSARGFLSQLKDEVELTDQQMALLESIISKIGNSSDLSKGKISDFSSLGQDAGYKVAGAFGRAVLELQKLGDEDMAKTFAEAQSAFLGLINNGEDVETAFQKICKQFGITEDKAGELKTALQIELGEGAYEALTKSTDNAISKTKSYTGALEEQSKQIENVASKAESSTEKVKLHGKAAEIAAEHTKGYNDAMDKSPSIFNSLGTLISGLAPTLLSSFGKKTDYEDKAKDNLVGFKTGIEDNKDSLITTPLQNAVTESLNGFSNTEQSEKAGGFIVDGIAKGILGGSEVIKTAIDAISDSTSKEFNAKNEMASPSRLYERLAQNIPLGVAKGVRGKKAELNSAVTELVKTLRTKFNTELTSLKSTLNTRGGSLATAIGNGFTSKSKEIDLARKIRDWFGNDKNSVWSALDQIKQEFANYGAGIAGSFVAGLESVKIPKLRYVQGSNYDTHNLPFGGTFQTPQFIPYWDRWYARGALFTRASIVGVGEAGDEAALPLENKQVMNRIATAITDNMNGVGIDDRELVEAITQGYINAMMSMNNQNQQDNVFNITVKTMNDEVLARAVQRGNKKLNYRNSPSASY